MAPKNKHKRLRDSDQDTDTDSENESFLDTTANWPRFLVVESVSVDLPLSKLSPFANQKGFQATGGTFKSIKRLRDGSFLVECSRKPQATCLLKTTQFTDWPMHVSIHKALNSSHVMTEVEIKTENWSHRLKVFLMKQLMLFMLAEHHLINPHIHYMKHKYCCCRWLVVTFVYYEFGTLSCATNLEKVPPFVPNIPETENVPQWSPQTTWALISCHLSFWGFHFHLGVFILGLSFYFIFHQAARPDSVITGYLFHLLKGYSWFSGKKPSPPDLCHSAKCQVLVTLWITVISG